MPNLPEPPLCHGQANCLAISTIGHSLRDHVVLYPEVEELGVVEGGCDPKPLALPGSQAFPSGSKEGSLGSSLMPIAHFSRAFLPDQNKYFSSSFSK